MGQLLLVVYVRFVCKARIQEIVQYCTCSTLVTKPWGSDATLSLYLTLRNVIGVPWEQWIQPQPLTGFVGFFFPLKKKSFPFKGLRRQLNGQSACYTNMRTQVQTSSNHVKKKKTIVAYINNTMPSGWRQVDSEADWPSSQLRNTRFNKSKR